jgi:hypothetical protein
MSPIDIVIMQDALAGEANPEIVEVEARLRAAQLSADTEALGESERITSIVDRNEKPQNHRAHLA